MKILLTAATVVVALGFASPAWCAADTETARCAAIQVGKPVNFHGRTLEEIPDITEPELRLADQLLSSGCGQRAEAVYQGFVRAHPENFHAAYYLARSSWLQQSPAEAYQVLTQVLAKYPDFASAKVLLAGLQFSVDNVDEVKRLLDEVEPRSPTDVWIYINRSRIAGRENPPPAALEGLMLEVARNPEFPPNVRLTAVEIGKPLTGASADEYEEFLRIAAGIRSPNTACEVARLATYMSDAKHYDEVRELLESPQAQAGHCLGLRENRLLLAQAYLMQAASINRNPVRANAGLIAKAEHLIDGEYREFADWLASQQRSGTFLPLLRGKLDPDEQDEMGFSPLCHAAVLLNTELVGDYLQAGANPRSLCGGTPIMLLLAMLANGTNTEGLQATARVLLEHGAQPPAELCGKVRDPSFCSRDLQVLFQSYLPRP